MIARVKIAPVEQWCEHPRLEGIRMVAIVGLEAEIIPATMSVDWKYCNGRRWELTKKSGLYLQKISSAPATPDIPLTVYEHMLEMD